MQALFHEVTVASLDDSDTPIRLNIADEVPVRLLFNGIIPYGVMMVTPDHLDDFAYGFCLTENVVQSAAQIRAVTVSDDDDGVTLHVTIDGDCLALLLKRSPRALTGHSSCGLCGSDAVPHVDGVGAPPFQNSSTVAATAIRRALDDLDRWQDLNARTRMVHGAAWADRGGRIHLIREDIGRHNALDKLIGARLRDDAIPRDGICVLTSRYSFEMALKTARAGMDVVVAISAPTYRALRLAEQMHQTLIAIARHDRQFVFCGAARVTR